MKKTSDRGGESQQSNNTVQSTPSSPPASFNEPAFKWKSILAIAVAIIATWYGLNWLWGIFFLVWAGNDLINQATYFVEPITRKDNPILYFTIVGMWICFGVLMLVYGY